MFKKKCSKCNEKVGKSYDFCPSCGNNLNSEYDEQDYGILGKNDFIDEKSSFLKPNPSFIDKIFKTAIRELPSMIKMIEKQMQNSVNSFEKQAEFPNKISSNMRVQFFVNGKKVLPENNHEQKEQIKLIIKNFPEEKLRRLSKLPQKEPKSNVRRLSNKIIYELSVPGVKNIEDILVNQLENSIEIKALAKDKFYLKNININLPILSYTLDNGSLILELQAK